MAWPRDHSATALIEVGGTYIEPEVSAQRLQGHHWEQGQGYRAHGLYKGHGVTASQPGVGRFVTASVTEL